MRAWTYPGESRERRACLRITTNTYRRAQARTHAGAGERAKRPRICEDAAVNRHQALALDWHCRLSVETMQPKFARMLPNGLSVVLTVNSGYE